MTDEAIPSSDIFTVMQLPSASPLLQLPGSLAALHRPMPVRDAPTWTSNVPISTPVLYPGYELADFNGFAFTHVAGIVVQYVEAEEDWRKQLSP